MSKIYKFLGVSCGYINNNQDEEERLKNYSYDITYATNSELGFDYLKDNMKYSSNKFCLLYTSPSPRDSFRSRMPSSA